MKTTRKLLAFVMVIAMIMAMAISASAETATIQNALEGTTYSFYKILEWDGTYYKAVSEWETETSTIFNFVNGYATTIPTDGAALAATLKGSVAGKTAITHTVTSGDNTVDLAPGYYLMVSGDGLASIAPIVSGENLTIREKNTATGLPTIDKTMTPAGTQFYVGDTRSFTITVVLDEGDDIYTITDTMTGLKLKNAITPPTVANAAVTVTAGGAAGDTGFTITIDFNDGYKSQANTTVTITYEAEITDSGYIKNDVKLNDGSSNYNDVVEETQYSFTLKKTDGTNQINGAEFVLKNDAGKFATFNGSNELIGWVDAQIDATPISVGSQELKGIAAGNYSLLETKAPAGYAQLTTETSVAIVVSGTGYTVNGAADHTVAIANTALNPLPETGGMGTTLFYTLGGLMVMAAAVLLVTKKRVSV